jgi:glucose-6-phosphate isomerase, archaeal
MENTTVSDFPTSVQFNFETGEFLPYIKFEQRCLSDLAPMFYDQQAVQGLIGSGDRLVYDIRYHPFITSNSDMALGTTRIFPGKVGDEYHMTKGHFHERNDQPEIYFCLQGVGYLLMETLDGDFQTAPWKPGTITHITPKYAHRVVNTGDQPLIFVASFHISAGHVYDPVVERGFAQVVVEQNGAPVFLPNPRRR